MKHSYTKFYVILRTLLIMFLSSECIAQSKAESLGYLDSLKTELQKTWPNNNTVNLVFHGHSVPAGYFKTPEVNTLAIALIFFSHALTAVNNLHHQPR
mgnify:CR=1 FL=1